MATSVTSPNISPIRMDSYFPRVVNGPPFRGNEEMRYEGVRLKTFNDWPNWAAVWPTLVARAGFYYTKTADEVVCFCCSGRLKSWEDGDSPLTEHKRLFPQCLFVTGRDTRNMPLGEPPEAPSSGQGSHTCNPHVSSDYYSSLASYAGSSATRHDRLLDMKLESNRLESFTNWPTIAYVRPENLAKAGLYYFGIADRMKCAFCNGILRNWEQGDEPMVEHWKFFPNCAFLRDARAAGNVTIDEERDNIQQAAQNVVAHSTPSSELGVASEADRLPTFRQRPRDSNQSPEVLAGAAFLYTATHLDEVTDVVSVSGFPLTAAGQSTRLDEVTDVMSVVSGFPLTAAGLCKYCDCPTRTGWIGSFDSPPTHSHIMLR